MSHISRLYLIVIIASILFFLFSFVIAEKNIHRNMPGCYAGNIGNSARVRPEVNSMRRVLTSWSATWPPWTMCMNSIGLWNVRTNIRHWYSSYTIDWNVECSYSIYINVLLEFLYMQQTNLCVSQLMHECTKCSGVYCTRRLCYQLIVQIFNLFLEDIISWCFYFSFFENKTNKK